MDEDIEGYMLGRFGGRAAFPEDAELPREGESPVVEMPVPGPVVKPNLRAVENPEPRITARQFASRLPVEHRGGFLAFCEMQDLPNRKTVAQWKEIVSAHWARKIK